MRVTHRPGVKVITTIILGRELTGNLRISKKLVEIHNGIEDAAGADKLVDALPRLFALGVRVRLAGEIGRGAEGCDGCAKDGDAVGMDEADHLLVGLDEGGIDLVLDVGGGRCTANVVYAFEDHGVLDAWVGEDVAVNTAKSIRAEAVCENTVSACGKVADGDGLCGWVLLEAGEEEVWPSVVLVGGGATAIRDAIANDKERADVLWDPGFDRRNKIPVCC